MQADRRLAVQGSQADGSTGGGAGAVFGTPAVVMGLRSEIDVLQDPSLSDDELEIYFMSVTNDGRDIWRSRRAAGTDPWGAASLVAELSTAAQEEDPDLASDGLTIYFSSDRSEGPGVMRLWFSRRAARDEPWGPPETILGLGASRSDVAPSVDRSGLTLVFASMRDNLDFHLFSATRVDSTAAWGLAQELSAVNSEWQDRDPALFDRGNALVFCSRRTGQGRTSDLFHVARSDPTAAFAAVPAAIGELNSDAWEGDPWLSDAGRHIVFVSDRTGTPRIYESWR
jgi:hypothetical protein